MNIKNRKFKFLPHTADRNFRHLEKPLKKFLKILL